MHPTRSLANPFMMMTDPEVILQAVERSERLSRLRRHVCRPLDKPLIPKVGAKLGAQGQAEFDHEIDVADVADETTVELDYVS